MTGVVAEPRGGSMNYSIDIMDNVVSYITLILFHMALQPNAGYGLLIHEVFEITNTTRHSR
jgi:hypothetical protein